MKRPLAFLGGLVTITGLAGKIFGNYHLENNPVEGAAGQVATAFGADVSAEVRLALFFNDYGILIALIGAVLLALAFVMGRR